MPNRKLANSYIFQYVTERTLIPVDTTVYTPTKSSLQLVYMTGKCITHKWDVKTPLRKMYYQNVGECGSRISADRGFMQR